MIYEFELPDIGEGLSEAELLDWLVGVGDAIEEGQDIASISTDKVNVDIPSPRAGTVAELPWTVGDVIPVGDVFMRIEVADVSGNTVVADSPDPTRSVKGKDRATKSAPSARVKAPPALRRYAKELGVDLNTITPTGDRGQVLQADIDRYLESAQDTFRLSGARLAAAKRVSKSSELMATASQSFDVFGDSILAATEAASAGDTTQLSPLVVIAERVANVLGSHRKFNATLTDTDNELALHDHVNLGIAVNTEHGLMVPVIHEADQKDAVEISQGLSEVIGRARDNSLTANDIRGATFTISSTGGLEQATMTSTSPVINLPNVATLWISRITQRPRVVDGHLEAGPIMSCTLAFDHRFIDGAEGQAFINDLNNAFTQN